MSRKYDIHKTTQSLIDSKHLELCLLNVRDSLCRSQLDQKNIRVWLECLPRVSPPVVPEGIDAQKSIAKITFKNLPQPAKNLLLGLTELESQLSDTKCLAEEAAISSMWDTFFAHLDSLTSHCNVLQDSLLEIFRECEQRVYRDWLEQVTEESIADLCVEVSSFVSAMDAYAEKKFAQNELVWSMYTDLRNFEDSEDDSKDLQNLYKKSVQILSHARECQEFLRKRVLSNHAIQGLSDAAAISAEKAVENVDNRFQLHEIYRVRQSGQIQPKEAKNIQEWTSHLDNLQKAEASFQKSRKVETESVRSASYAEEWTTLSKDFELAESKARKLKELTAVIRVKTAHSQRKKQELLIKQATQKWSLVSLNVKAIEAQSSEAENRLLHSKSLMLNELAELQKTFRFAKSDIDLIFQSVSSGISISAQSKAYEFLQENMNRTESIFRSFVDWQQRLQAILC